MECQWSRLWNQMCTDFEQSPMRGKWTNEGQSSRNPPKIQKLYLHVSEKS
jgi:hypothetical protein